MFEVALAIRVGVPHLERVARGIRDYSRENAGWRFVVSPETHNLSPRALEGWRGDGVIALCNSREDEAVLRELDCPVVNISGALRETAFPRVRNDYREIGTEAAHFLRRRGFRRFGFYGVSQLWYSELIEAGFGAAIAEMRLPPADVLHSPSSIGTIPSWNHGHDELNDWLSSVEPPFAILAAHDPRASMVIRACERLGLRVPGDVAVLGVNDDTSTCEASHPPLSSIDRNGIEVGWKAAAILDRMMGGAAVPAETIVPAGDIHERESTRTLAVDHPALAAAVRLVREKYGEPLTVEDIAEASGRSRRWLEQMFRTELQRSPSEFLRETRVDAAVALLRENADITLGRLAAETGFSGTRQLNSAFLESKGMPVREFRGG